MIGQADELLHRIIRGDSVSHLIQGATPMPDPLCDDIQAGHVMGQPVAEPDPSDEPTGEEEKILAGNVNVNMPALLTKDVPGG
jgi:hypothetical protein